MYAAATTYGEIESHAQGDEPAFAKLLSQAQLERQLLERRLAEGGWVRPDDSLRPFEHPYYWGGFELIGDWR